MARDDPQKPLDRPYRVRAESEEGEAPRMARGADKLIGIDDVALLFFLPVLFVFAWLTPERLWWWTGRVLTPALRAGYKRSRAQHEALINTAAGNHSLSSPPKEIVTELAQTQFVRMAQAMALLFGGRWRPKIEIEGLAHLEYAVKRDRGVILWDANTRFGSLVTKMALYREDYRAHHLSVSRHGFSGSRFGIRFLNPLWNRSEERYLAERVVMGWHTNPVVAMRRLLTLLKEKKVVSVTVRRRSAEPVVGRFMNAASRMAPGAADLAYRSGSSLVPTFSAGLGPGRYKLIISAPIVVDRSKPREEAVAEAVQAYLKQLEPLVEKHPGQWVDWYGLEVKDG